MHTELIANVVRDWVLIGPGMTSPSPPPTDFIKDVSQEISRFSKAQGSFPEFSLEGKWIVSTSPEDTPHRFGLFDLVIIMGCILNDRQSETRDSPLPRINRDCRDAVFANAMTPISFRDFNFQ